MGPPTRIQIGNPMPPAHDHDDRAARRAVAVVEGTDAMILVLSAPGRVEFANPRAREVLGASCGQPEGTTADLIAALVHPPGVDLATHLLAHPVSMEVTLTRGTAASLVLSIGATALQDSGDAPAALIVAHDVTRMVKLHRRLAQTQHLLATAELSRAMAHQFNNMHQSIVALASVVLDELPPGHPSRENVEDILDTTHRGVELSRDLLGLTNLSAGDMPALDLNDVVMGVVERARAAAPAAIDVRFTPLQVEVPVRAVRDLLDTVLDRLCADAVLDMPGGGQLELSVSVEDSDSSFRQEHLLGWRGPFARVEVRDTGCGMSAEVVNRRFEPTIDDDRPSIPDERSLSKAWGLVRAFLGTMSLASAPGEGTRVCLYLPTEGGQR